MREFTRTIITTTIQPTIITFEDGEVKSDDLEPIIVHGKLTLEKALKLVHKVTKKAVVKSMTTKEVKYGMKITDFIKNAYIVEDEKASDE